jgi:predicted lactoylglutathione lyase
MTKMIFVSLPVTDLGGSIAFYRAVGFEQNPQFSDDTAACMVWSEAIYVMLLTHAKWRTFTDRPFPPAGSAGMMLSLAMESRDAVDAMNRSAATHGGRADVNPAQDLGFMYTRDLADPDGHMWAAFWMDRQRFRPPSSVYDLPQPGMAAACRTHLAIRASSRSDSWMSIHRASSPVPPGGTGFSDVPRKNVTFT